MPRHGVLEASLGLLGAKLFTLRGDPTNDMLPVFYFSPEHVTLGAGIALTVGLLAGSIPAWSAMRLRVVDALRRV